MSKLRRFILIPILCISWFYGYHVTAADLIITQDDFEEFAKNSDARKSQLSSRDTSSTDTKSLPDTVVLIKCSFSLSTKSKLELERNLKQSDYNEIKDYLRVALPVYGTGFFIHNDGYLCTNKHLFEPIIDNVPLSASKYIEISYVSGRIEIILNAGKKNEQILPASIYQEDTDLDLAILSCPYLSPFKIRVNDLKVPTLGEKLHMCGFPFGKDPQDVTRNIFVNKSYYDAYAEYPAPSLNIGAVSSIRKDKNGSIDIIQLDIRANPGNSGSPVIDDNGKFVGILTWRIRDSISMDYIIPAEKVVDFLKKYINLE